jgi:subtilisin family serine protease
MRALVRAVAVCAALMAAAARAAPPADAPPVQPPVQPPRIVVAFANEPHTAPGPAGTTGSRYGGDGYTVGQSAQQQAHRVALAYSLREVASWPIKALSMHCVVYEVTDGRSVPEVLAALSKDSRVVLAQPLHEFHTLAGAAPPAARYNDPLYDLQTNLVALGIERAHARAQGAGVRIALIDTGVDTRHPDLAGRIRSTHSFLATFATPVPPASPALLRHGTAMAGLIAAVANNHIGIVGIAPQAQLEVFEACWQLEPDSDAAACNTFTLARALAAVLASGAPLVNLSLAGPSDPLLTALVERGLARGITFIGAVGAPGESFPAAIHGVLAAAASEQPLPEGAFGAPGQHVLTLRPGGQYDFESGASVAAAELTGVIALLMSASSTRLTSGAIAALLRGGVAAGAAARADPPVVDAGAALGRLETGGHGGAAGVAHAAH